jgi:hypothetical protein
MSLGILGGGSASKKMARPLSYSIKGLGNALGALEFCPAPCSTIDPEVKTYQSMMNAQLKRLKYNQVLVDGKLGKGTCGLNMFFSQVPELFDTTVSSWNDDLAFQVSKACDGKPYALPSPVTKANNVFAPNSEDPVCKSQSIPWGGSSIQDPHGSGTISVPLTELNSQLNDLGYEPISSSSIDPETCGAMKLIDALNNTQYLCQPGFNCKSFTAPRKKVTAVAVAKPVVVTAPVATGPAVPQTKKFSAASMATTGLIAGVAGLGIYFLGKSRHWF